jgi:RNA polymerase sigma factor (sigma-70 family)
VVPQIGRISCKVACRARLSLVWTESPWARPEPPTIHGVRSDAELAAAARAGDQDAFAAIYDRYADRLHDFCYSILRDRHEAGDAMQDTFVLAARHLDRLRDLGALRSWLFAIARREALHRATAQNRVLPTEDAGADERSEGPDPEDAVIGGDAATVVWQAAAGLAERDRVLLDLHVRQGLDGKELAEALGTTPSHAYVLMTRLRDQVERSIGALLVARLGRRDCEELQQVLAGWDGTFSPLWRKRVARHVEDCETCSEQRRSLASPLALLAAAPLVPAPLALRALTLERMNRGGGGSVRSWRRPRGRGGFPPPLSRGPRPRTVVAAAAAAILVGALAAGGLLAGGGSGAPVTIRADRGTTQSTAAPGATTTSMPAASDAATSTTVATAAPPGRGGGSGPSPPPPPPPRDTTPPTLTNLTIQSSCIDQPSGTEVLGATAFDDSGLASVVVEVRYNNGSQVADAGPMTPSGGDRYSRTVAATSFPPPFATATWTVTATDGAGNQSTASGPPFDVGCIH